MDIGRIGGLTGIPEIKPINAEDDAPQSTFAGILNSIVNPVVETDAADKMTNYGLMMDELQNTHNLTIAAEKANLALSLTIQIRNKAVDAYKEIMGMQV